MPLTKPALANVTPGQPVTAQAWNTIVDGLGTLYDAVLAIGTGVLQVRVEAGGNPLPGAQVVGVPLGEGNPIVALPLYGDVTTYELTGVTPGNWRILVQAPGFAAETRDVTAPATEPLVVSLTPAGVVVPDLFGVAAQEALARLQTLGLSVDLILDITGHEVSRATLPPQYQNSPVLLQLPEAGSVLDPASQRVRLVVAAAIEQLPVVTMPSLIGLSQDEVATVLNQLGLVLGTTTVRNLPPIQPIP
jgi:hypothetical protein